MKSFTTALLATAIALPSAAYARTMTAEDVARLEYVSGFAISDDGTQIAYNSFGRPDVTTGEKNGSGTRQLFVADGPMQGLMARAVVVLDGQGTVLHTQLVDEIANEPDYDAALAALG